MQYPHNRRRQHRLTDQLIGKADQALTSDLWKLASLAFV